MVVLVCDHIVFGGVERNAWWVPEERGPRPICPEDQHDYDLHMQTATTNANIWSPTIAVIDMVLLIR